MSIPKIEPCPICGGSASGHRLVECDNDTCDMSPLPRTAWAKLSAMRTVLVDLTTAIAIEREAELAWLEDRSNAAADRRYRQATADRIRVELKAREVLR